ncbi:MAG TPA: ASCH domain-containing protein [Ruminiclostridium sp.]
MKILLSIKPEYVENILNGSKKYEFRKRIASKHIDTIVIYSSSPKKKVVAEVKVMDTISMSPSALWEKTKKEAGISRTKFREYFRGCIMAHTYQLGEVKVYNEPKTLEDFNISHAPQSFVYLK